MLFKTILESNVRYFRAYHRALYEHPARAEIELSCIRRCSFVLYRLELQLVLRASEANLISGTGKELPRQ